MVRRTSEVKDVETSATKILGVTDEKIVKLKKIWAHNTATSDITFYFCDSGGTQKTPNIKVIAGQTLFVSELELPEYAFESDIYALASATGLKLMIEVEESG